MNQSKSLNHTIAALAVPALGALVAEPLFVLIDSAMVGHLGAASLAGLALASTIITTAVGVFVFLSYATTATTARHFGAGNQQAGLRAGIDGIWLSLLLGVLTAIVGWIATDWLVQAMGASGGAAQAAHDYLRTAVWGLPGMLAVLAATGTLRGLLNTRTPFVVASGGAVVNVGLNALFIYGLHLGVAGSGLGTAITQTLMGLILCVIVVRGARAAGVTLRPHRSGLGSAFGDGMPLLLRTLSLRVAILLTVWAATALGTTALAAHQIVNSLWGFASFALDALAIAAQALVGTALGQADAAQALAQEATFADGENNADGATANPVTPDMTSDLPGVRVVLRRSLAWGVGAGVVIGVVLAGFSTLLPYLFTDDAAVATTATPVLILTAVTMPLAGVVYLLDGVLIGAGDGKYLALAGLLNLVPYAPLALLVGNLADGGSGLLWLWAAFAVVYMAARALTTGLRARLLF